MASLWEDERTPYWAACISAPVGQRLAQLKKSTGTRDRKLATSLANEYEEAAQGRRSVEAILTFLATIKDLRTQRVARRSFDSILRLTTGAGLGSKSARGYITEWLDRTRGEVSTATFAKYQQAATSFLASLGGKADQDLSAVQQSEIARFRDAEGKRVSASTANLSLKIVRLIFGAAEADGVLRRNEAKHVKKLRSRSASRRPFTLPEMARILEACDPEWRSLVLFGFYTGARLGDIATLTWQSVDLQRGELRFVTRKTDRPIVFPLAEPLRRHIEGLPAGDDPKQPVHPRAFEIVMREGRSGTLSRQFGEILAAAGLVPKRSHQADEGRRKGRGSRRQQSEVSFHALRHTAVSLLKSAGVSDAVARDLVGHESPEVSQLYTHIADDAKRAAVDKLPVIGAATTQA